MMNDSDIIKRRLANHQLSGSSFTSVGELVSWMGAIQAQDFNMAKWAIGARLNDVSDVQIEKALDRGEIVRTHIMRPTWHFVSADDIHWLMELTAPRIRIATRSRDKDLGLTPEVIKQTNAVIERELQKGVHLTRQEIGVRLQEAGIVIDNARLTHMMYHAELAGIVCNGELQKKKQTYSLLQEKVPKTESLLKEEALERLARKYFSSHGPASLPDFVWWSGLTASEARLGLELAKKDFVSVQSDGQEYWFSEHAGSETGNDDNHIHLLPAFDEYFVGYRNRRHIVSDDHYNKIVTSMGIFRPMIVKGGQIIGKWKRIASKSGITIEPELFYEQDKHTLKLLDKAKTEYEKYNGKE